jgi:hypothetical protein
VHRRRIDHERGRAKQEAIDEREHRRVGADPEREGERHANSEDWISPEIAQRVCRVLPERLERGPEPDGSGFLAHQRLVAHRPPSLDARRVRRQATTNQITLHHLPVKRDLVHQVGVVR